MLKTVQRTLKIFCKALTNRYKYNAKHGRKGRNSQNWHVIINWGQFNRHTHTHIHIHTHQYNSCLHLQNQGPYAETQISRNTIWRKLCMWSSSWPFATIELPQSPRYYISTQSPHYVFLTQLQHCDCTITSSMFEHSHPQRSHLINVSTQSPS